MGAAGQVGQISAAVYVAWGDGGEVVAEGGLSQLVGVW